MNLAVPASWLPGLSTCRIRIMIFHIRKKAKQLSLEYHDLLQVFDQPVSHHLISKEVAITKLTNLYDLNLLYKNNAQWLKATD